jgi:glycosyltransferase involved in cell wall biosynthesis
VRDGETGILVGGGRPDEIKEAIDLLWENPGKRQTMGRLAAEWVVGEFSLDRWVAKMSAELRDITNH